MSEPALPEFFFDRVDSSPDSGFYSQSRLVTHIDDATIAALTEFYRERLSPESSVLDLMSSWVSHLPQDVDFARVTLLGMNAEELARNRQADDWCVHDLNAQPSLPFEDASFDAVVNAVSIQYLVRPVEVFSSIRRVLKPGGLSIVAMSHRCFPTKAVRIFHEISGNQRMALVARYHELATGFDGIEAIDRSPENADPLWIVVARRSLAEP